MNAGIVLTTCVFYMSTTYADNEAIAGQHEQKSDKPPSNLSEKLVIEEPTKTTFRDWKKEVYALYDSISTDFFQKYLAEKFTNTPIRLKWHITKRSSAEFEQIESELLQLALSTDIMMKYINEALTNTPIRLKIYSTLFTDWEDNDYWNRSSTPLGQTFRTNPFIDRLYYMTRQAIRQTATVITAPVDSKERTLNVWEKMERLYRRKLTTASPTPEKKTTQTMITFSNNVETTTFDLVKRIRELHRINLDKLSSQNADIRPKDSEEWDPMQSILFQKMLRINEQALNASEQTTKNIANLAESEKSNQISVRNTTQLNLQTRSTYRDWKKEVYMLYDSISTDYIQKYLADKYTNTPIRLKWHITKRSSAEFEQIESELMQLALSTDVMMKLIYECLTNPPIKLKLYNTRFTDWEENDYWHRSTTPLGQTFRTNSYIDRLYNKPGKTKKIRPRATIITRKVDSKERTLNVWEKMERLYRRNLTSASTTSESSSTHNVQSQRVKRSLDRMSASSGTTQIQIINDMKTKKRSETDELFDSMMEAEEELFSEKKLKKIHNFKKLLIGERVNEKMAKFDMKKLQLKQENASWDNMYTVTSRWGSPESVESVADLSNQNQKAASNATDSFENFLALGRTQLPGDISMQKFDNIIKKGFDAFDKRYAQNDVYKKLMNGVGWGWENTTELSTRYPIYPGGVLFTMKTDEFDRLDSPKTKRPLWKSTRKITCKAFLGLIRGFYPEERKVAEKYYQDLPSGESSEPRDLSDINVMMTERWGAVRNVSNSLLLHAMRYMKDDEIERLKAEYQLYPPL